MIVVENYAMETRLKSDARDPQMRQEEDLAFGARGTLEDIRVRYGIDMMMAALRQVAEHFEVDREQLIRGWVKHYGPGFLVESGMSAEDVLGMWDMKR